MRLNSLHLRLTAALLPRRARCLAWRPRSSPAVRGAALPVLRRAPRYAGLRRAACYDGRASRRSTHCAFAEMAVLSFRDGDQHLDRAAHRAELPIAVAPRARPLRDQRQHAARAAARHRGEHAGRADRRRSHAYATARIVSAGQASKARPRALAARRGAATGVAAAKTRSSASRWTGRTFHVRSAASGCRACRTGCTSSDA